jgi:hypothetical protein
MALIFEILKPLIFAAPHFVRYLLPARGRFDSRSGHSPTVVLGLDPRTSPHSTRALCVITGSASRVARATPEHDEGEDGTSLLERAGITLYLTDPTVTPRTSPPDIRRRITHAADNVFGVRENPTTNRTQPQNVTRGSFDRRLDWRVTARSDLFRCPEGDISPHLAGAFLDGLRDGKRRQPANTCLPPAIWTSPFRRREGYSLLVIRSINEATISRYGNCPPGDPCAHRLILATTPRLADAQGVRKDSLPGGLCKRRCGGLNRGQCDRPRSYRRLDSLSKLRSRSIVRQRSTSAMRRLVGAPNDAIKPGRVVLLARGHR